MIEQRRYVTVEAGENKTGHVNTGPSEALVYFDCMCRIDKLSIKFLLCHHVQFPMCGTAIHYFYSYVRDGDSLISC